MIDSIKGISRYLVIYMILFIIVSVIPAKSAWAASYYNWPPFPSETIGINQPTIQMKFQFNGLQVSSYQMLLNGVPVSAQYNQDSSTFSYTPKQPLPAGEYNVKLILHFQGYGSKEHNWSFRVAQDAVSTLALPNGNQEEAIKTVNTFRKNLGLPILKLNDYLDSSAKAHAVYMSNNDVLSHSESVNSKGYIGKTALDRASYYGYYSKGIAEDISEQSDQSPINAINSLFDAPYHRLPFMNPNVTDMGYGKSGDYHVIDFGISDSSSKTVVVVSPAENQQIIPVSWDGHEYPDPLRIHSETSYPVGYPIVVGVYGDDVKNVSILSAQLTSPNATQALLWNSDGKQNPDNELSNAVILIPKHSLQFGTNYQAQVKLSATMNDGTQETFNKSWNFTTENEDDLAQEQLRQSIYHMYQHVIDFGLDDTQFSMDHSVYSMVVPPMIQNNRAYLSIRDLEKALLANVKWDDTNKAAIYTKGNKTVIFYTNRSSYKLNGVTKTTKTPAILVATQNGGARTMVPVRLLAESLGCTVDYDNQTRSVIIHY